MIGAAARKFSNLPTTAKLLLILTAALLPIGIVLAMVAQDSLRSANEALQGRANDRARLAARGMESLIARNVLALRIAANGALSTGPGGACARAQRSLAVSPGVTRGFQLERTDGSPFCSVGTIAAARSPRLLAPGDIRLLVSDDRRSLVVRVGVIDGRASSTISAEELRDAAIGRAGDLDSVLLNDGRLDLEVLTDGSPSDAGRRLVLKSRIANRQLGSLIAIRVPGVTALDRLLRGLPLLMWVMAALITWLLVNRLLIRPLKILERAVNRVQPGAGSSALPRKLGPATEIQQLRDAFARGLDRIEDSDREMASALDGQRRLVREVHHRVKNNLQVVASLLNIHGRSAATSEAKAAYASIGRRVGALSIVHRNHFAEMEENRGIALRPLLAELVAELRAGAPDEARGTVVDIDVESVSTTQDVAVSAAFLITEIIEYAMLNRPEDPIEVDLRRASELTARLSVASPVLVPDEADQAEKVQFERIIGGLAKQLRSPLDRRLGRYSVDLPVFPDR